MAAVELERLVRTPASDLKKLGWRGVMRNMAEAPAGLVVTNHDEPEAVIVSTAIYKLLFSAFQREQRQHEAALEKLRREFDERLAVLNEPDAGARLRAAAATTVKLEGNLRIPARKNRQRSELG